MSDALCGYRSPHQGEEPFGPTSPCTLAPGHVEYHEDDSGLPFGPWIGGGSRTAQECRVEAEKRLEVGL